MGWGVVWCVCGVGGCRVCVGGRRLYGGGGGGGLYDVGGLYSLCGDGTHGSFLSLSAAM